MAVVATLALCLAWLSVSLSALLGALALLVLSALSCYWQPTLGGRRSEAILSVHVSADPPAQANKSPSHTHAPIFP